MTNKYEMRWYPKFLNGKCYDIKDPLELQELDYLLRNMSTVMTSEDESMDIPADINNIIPTYDTEGEIEGYLVTFKHPEVIVLIIDNNDEEILPMSFLNLFTVNNAISLNGIEYIIKDVKFEIFKCEYSEMKSIRVKVTT